MAQWLGSQTTEPRVRGSSPDMTSGVAFMYATLAAQA